VTLSRGTIVLARMTLDHWLQLGANQLAILGAKWRVIECRDGEQWILQKKSNKWESRSYCRTSAVLERVVREHVGSVDLPDLPNWSTNGPVVGTWECRRRQPPKIEIPLSDRCFERWVYPSFKAHARDGRRPGSTALTIAVPIALPLTPSLGG
jgi:hypothetical protein